MKILFVQFGFEDVRLDHAKGPIQVQLVSSSET